MMYLFSARRYKCSECPDYDLCYDCITMSNLLHNMQHHFLKILNPLEQKDVPKDTSTVPVTISPILPTTKEEMLNLLHEEEQQRLSPETQKQYYNVGNDPAFDMDWMDVTNQMQYKLVRESGYSDEAVQLLRRASQLYQGKKGDEHIYSLFFFPIIQYTVHNIINFEIFFFPHHSDDPAFHTTQLYVRNNIARVGDLTEGMTAPDCQLVPLDLSTLTAEVITLVHQSQFPCIH